MNSQDNINHLQYRTTDRFMRQQASILLVEDDTALQEGIRDLLEVAETGYELTVRTADDGAQGLERLREESVDLIISDVMMPKVNGYEFLAAVRQEANWVHIPFIFLTAKGKKSDILEGNISGADLYITKPFHSNELIDLVKAQLNRTFELQALRQGNMDKLKRTIMQLFNHEFRTPLTYVTSYSEMLTSVLDEELEEAHLEAYLRGIQSGCNRLTDLIADLLMVMDIRTGELLIEYSQKEEVIHDAGRLLRAPLAKVEELRSRFDVEVVEQVEYALPPVRGVPEHLETLFHQLIENAVKFTGVSEKSSRVVTLSAFMHPENRQEVCFQVKDNGVGIPQAAHAEIFDLFYQHNRELFEQQGSGAGLAIVAGIIRAHQGRIEVESAVGEGSTFTVILPVAGAHAAMKRPRTGYLPQEVKVLVVEDEPFLRYGLAELLKLFRGEFRLDVETAVDGVDALDKIAHQLPDLIISDIMMPNLDGFGLLEAVRQNPERMHIPFIFLTARNDRKDIHRGRQSGADQYIVKPYESEELLAMVNATIKRHFQKMAASQKDFENLKQAILRLVQPELQTPLSSVATLTENLQAVESPEEMRSTLFGIQAGSQRLSELVDDLITLAELKTGEIQTTFMARAEVVSKPGYFLIQLAEHVRRLLGDTPIDVVKHGELLAVQPVRIEYQRFSGALDRLAAVVVELAQQGEAEQIHLTLKLTAELVVMRIEHDGRQLDDKLAQLVVALCETGDERIVERSALGPALAIINGVVQVQSGQFRFRHFESQTDCFEILLPCVEEAVVV